MVTFTTVPGGDIDQGVFGSDGPFWPGRSLSRTNICSSRLRIRFWMRSSTSAIDPLSLTSISVSTVDGSKPISLPIPTISRCVLRSSCS